MGSEGKSLAAAAGEARRGLGRQTLILNPTASRKCTQWPDPPAVSGCWVCGFLSHTPAAPYPRLALLPGPQLALSPANTWLNLSFACI